MSRVNIKTGATKIYPGFEGPLTLPVENDADSFGRLWYSSATSNSLNVLNPFVGANGNTRVIKQPGTIVNPGGVPPAANIAIHYGPKNRMWFTQLALNRVGSYQLLGCGNNIKKCTK